MKMKMQVLPAFWVLLVFIINSVDSLILPYNPTTILVPQNLSASRGVAYILLGSSGSGTTRQLLSLNISSTISASNISLEDITPDLGFFKNDSTAYTPTISSAGEISVYAGSCESSVDSELWRFTPSNTTTNGNGTWESGTAVNADDVKASSLTGPQLLSGGFSFSILVNGNASESNIYTFGGMCPNSSTDSNANWQSSATYSNTVTRLDPPSSSTSLTYTIDIPNIRGPPIAEAGFTITGLSPIYSNISGTETQQQNFALIGGHTQTAFINMSQIAVWSLPEESWSFVGVDSPQGIPNTELAVKSTVERSPILIDSRSGHTAVLTEDGSSLIVYGGWVGDITQAANPQLVVLHLGTGFGGNGDWTWSIPTTQPSGPGIYGHGAAMLPGNVMMILGGYNISSSGNTKRATSINANPMFLNVTSMTWSSSYTNPTYIAVTVPHESASSSSKKSSSKTIGLGVGLGIGLAAVIAVIIAYIWYRRHTNQWREARDRDLRALSHGTADYSNYPDRQMTQRSGLFPWTNSRWNRSGEDGDSPVYEPGAVAGYDNPHNDVYDFGVAGDYPAPPPNRLIPRKPVHPRNTRGLYQPTPGFDFGSLGNHGRTNSLGTAGPIHPIYEDDEDADHSLAGVGVAIGDPPKAPSTADSNRYSDPFKDSQTVGPTSPTEAQISAQEREREISSWVSDWAAADALMQAQARSHSNAGRLSPSRRAQLITSNGSSASEDDSGRTASNLSERSAVSTASITRPGSASLADSRSNSLRGFIGTVVRPFSSSASTTPTPPSDAGGAHTQSGPIPHSARSSTSFATARTSFAALQAEGESLLGRRPDERDNSTPPHSPSKAETFDVAPGSPSKSKLPKPRGQSWLGPLRNVFGSTNSGSTSPGESSLSSRDESPSPTHLAAGSTQSYQGEPRRTMSAGATLWRRKQGKSDWEDSADADDATVTGRSNTFTGELNRDEHSDDEWDIERAVERRVVQVMFTVPKEKLRVVNHDVVEESDGASLVSVARHVSMKGEIGAVSPAEEKPNPLSEESIDNAISGGSSSVIGGGSSIGGAEASTTVSFNDSAIGSSEGGWSTPERDRKGKGKAKSRVLDIVEEMERRSSPERSSSPSSVRSMIK
ncbi:hypothetical protein B7463_g1323, partial [Scytalidium lignicola]